MKLIVTGGAGFIGSAVVRMAITQGLEIVNLDSLTYASCLDNVASVSNNSQYHFEHADIRQRSDIDRILFENRPDAVMHLAAESHVDRSIDSPSEFIETNIIGTFNLLEACRAYWNSSARPNWFRFHHVSTDEVFGSLPNDPSIKFHEGTPYDPRSPYSASKASSDHLVRAWHQTYGLPIVISNCSNNYGPYQYPEKFIPVVILNAIAGKPIPIYGSGHNIRDWLYVQDHADALLRVLYEGRIGDSYSIGGNNERQNIEIAKVICAILDKRRPKLIGSYADQITFVKDRPGHDTRYAINSIKINRELGWRPTVTLEEGLEKTVEWYLNNEDWWKTLQERKNVGTSSGTAS